MGMLGKLLEIVRGKPKRVAPPTLYFKDDQSAFEYACTYQRYELIKDQLLPCLVESVSNPPDGNSIAIIRIPHDGGEAKVIATFLSNGSHSQLEGSLCVAVVGETIESMGIPALMVVAELSPELTQNTWKIKRRL